MQIYIFIHNNMPTCTFDKNERDEICKHVFGVKYAQLIRKYPLHERGGFISEKGKSLTIMHVSDKAYKRQIHALRQLVKYYKRRVPKKAHKAARAGSKKCTVENLNGAVYDYQSVKQACIEWNLGYTHVCRKLKEGAGTAVVCNLTIKA